MRFNGLNGLVNSLICISFGLAACNPTSTHSSTEELQKNLKTAQSWAATAQFTADAWLKQSVPEHYAKKTVQKASQKIHQATQLSSPVQPNLLNSIQHLADTTDRLSAAIEQGDRATVLQQNQQLALEQQQVAALSQSMEPSP